MPFVPSQTKAWSALLEGTLVPTTTEPSKEAPYATANCAPGSFPRPTIPPVEVQRKASPGPVNPTTTEPSPDMPYALLLLPPRPNMPPLDVHTVACEAPEGTTELPAITEPSAETA